MLFACGATHGFVNTGEEQCYSEIVCKWHLGGRARQWLCCLTRLPPCREGVELVAELPVKRCNIARFSRGGQRFAAAGASNVITVHDTLTLQVVASLRVSLPGSTTSMHTTKAACSLGLCMLHRMHNWPGRASCRDTSLL